MSNYYNRIPDDCKKIFEDYNIPKEVFFKCSQTAENKSKADGLKKYMQQKISESLKIKKLGGNVKNKITNYLKIYNTIMSNPKENPFDFFNLIFLDRDIEQNIYFYPVYILDNLYCLLLQENLKMIYNQTVKKPLYYMHVYIKTTNRRSGHKCMIIVDTTKKPFRVYILDTVYPKIEASKDIDTLMKYALVPGFEYHGHIGKVSSKYSNLFGIQLKLSHGFCTIYSLFVIYIIMLSGVSAINNMRRSIKLFDDTINVQSLLQKDKLQYVFAYFMEKVFLLYFDEMGYTIKNMVKSIKNQKLNVTYTKENVGKIISKRSILNSFIK